ncbi:MAG TPA: extracellular solute-binding protein, partial [Limnochordia bacterium]|nr:extracellular solute-binding protein [Limnochordia bacterium]
VYGLPKDLQLGAIYYNKDHYDAAGLSYPSPDWTYDDLLQNAKRLTVVGADNQVTRYGFRLPTSRNWAPLIWAFGGDLLDSWTQPTRFTGDSDQVAAALQYLHDLVQLKAVQDKATFESVGTTAAFMSQKVSMLLTNSVVMADFGAIKDFAWDVAPFPQGPAGAVPYINAIGWFMFKGSAHPEASWEVLRYFTSQEALRRRVAVIGNIPPSRQVILDSWLPSRAQPAGRALLLNHIEQARSPWMLDERVFDPMNKEVLAAIWGEKSVQNAIQTMKQEVTGILAED